MGKTSLARFGWIAVVVTLVAVPAFEAVPARAATEDGSGPGAATPRVLESEAQDPVAPTVRSGDFSNAPSTVLA